jgi:hypothetical protein
MKPISLIHDIAALQKPISDVLSQNGESGGVPKSAHGDFWSTLIYSAFTTGSVPHADPPVPIVVIGNPRNPNSQMPANGPPCSAGAARPR